MYQLVNRNVAAVINAAENLGILEYLDLRSDLSQPDSALNPDFQRRYRNYWRMNVGRFSPAFYDRYFRHLNECQRAGTVDIRRTIEITSAPGEESRGLQFSFASKLVHMVEPSLPVYDSYVAAFYFYVPLPSGKPLSERVQGLLEFHAFLAREYRRIIDHGLLADAIAAFRRQHTASTAVPDQRIIDWLLWGWVAYLRTGAQHRGEALYT
jgi:hypothetical protein